MAAYGFSTKMTESDCVARLLEMYQELTKKQEHMNNELQIRNSSLGM